MTAPTVSQDTMFTNTWNLFQTLIEQGCSSFIAIDNNNSDDVFDLLQDFLTNGAYIECWQGEAYIGPYQAGPGNLNYYYPGNGFNSAWGWVNIPPANNQPINWPSTPPPPPGVIGPPPGLFTNTPVPAPAAVVTPPGSADSNLTGQGYTAEGGLPDTSSIQADLDALLAIIGNIPGGSSAAAAAILIEQGIANVVSDIIDDFTSFFDWVISEFSSDDDAE